MKLDKRNQAVSARPDIARTLKGVLLRLFPCLARIKRAEELRSARIKVNRSRLAVDDWTEYLEFKVFSDVQGDEIEPDTIHGQHLIVHFSEFANMGFQAQRAVCSDSAGRWFELIRDPGKFATIRRLNAKKAMGEVSAFHALVQLANSAGRNP